MMAAMPPASIVLAHPEQPSMFGLPVSYRVFLFRGTISPNPTRLQTERASSSTRRWSKVQEGRGTMPLYSRSTPASQIGVDFSCRWPFIVGRPTSSTSV
jgi:hypothetical protein